MTEQKIEDVLRARGITTVEALLDALRDTDRWRALEPCATYGITTRNGGRGSYLLYVHTMINCDPPIERGDFAECVDVLVRDSAKAKRLMRATMPTLEEVRPSDFRHLRGKD